MTNSESNSTNLTGPEVVSEWPHELYRILKKQSIQQVSYVPDAGHATLISLFGKDENVISNVLTTEEEGIALAVGAWLGGQRAAVLMQSSGVGNCINMLSLPVQARTPLLLLVTMRGEWGEFNPWQMPMGQATESALKAAGITVFRADTAKDIVETVAQAAVMAFDADQQIAVLIGQRVLGEKEW